MSQQPFSRPGAIDLSGLQQPAAGGAAEGGAVPGSSYSMQVTVATTRVRSVVMAAKRTSPSMSRATLSHSLKRKV